MLSDEPPPVVVKPVEKFSIFALPREISCSRMFHASSVRKALIYRLCPGMPVVPAVRAYRVPINRAVHAVKRSIAQAAVAVFFGDWTAPRWRPQPCIAIWKCLPGNFLWVLFCQDIFAFQEYAFRTGEKSHPESSHFVQRYVRGPIVGYRFAHVPEIPQFALVRVLPVNRHFSYRNRVALCRPRPPVIVAVFEYKMPQ